MLKSFISIAYRCVLDISNVFLVTKLIRPPERIRILDSYIDFPTKLHRLPAPGCRAPLNAPGSPDCKPS